MAAAGGQATPSTQAMARRLAKLRVALESAVRQRGIDGDRQRADNSSVIDKQLLCLKQRLLQAHQRQCQESESDAPNSEQVLLVEKSSKLEALAQQQLQCIMQTEADLKAAWASNATLQGELSATKGSYEALSATFKETQSLLNKANGKLQEFQEEAGYMNDTLQLQQEQIRSLEGEVFYQTEAAKARDMQVDAAQGFEAACREAQYLLEAERESRQQLQRELEAERESRQQLQRDLEAAQRDVSQEGLLRQQSRLDLEAELENLRRAQEDAHARSAACAQQKRELEETVQAMQERETRLSQLEAALGDHSPNRVREQLTLVETLQTLIANRDDEIATLKQDLRAVSPSHGLDSNGRMASVTALGGSPGGGTRPLLSQSEMLTHPPLQPAGFSGELPAAPPVITTTYATQLVPQDYQLAPPQVRSYATASSGSFPQGAPAQLNYLIPGGTSSHVTPPVSPTTLLPPQPSLLSPTAGYSMVPPAAALAGSGMVPGAYISPPGSGALIGVQHSAVSTPVHTLGTATTVRALDPTRLQTAPAVHTGLVQPSAVTLSYSTPYSTQTQPFYSASLNPPATWR